MQAILSCFFQFLLWQLPLLLVVCFFFLYLSPVKNVFLNNTSLLLSGIRNYLLENEQECPSCGAENVSPDSLVINKQLRQVTVTFGALLIRISMGSVFFHNFIAAGKLTSQKCVIQDFNSVALHMVMFVKSVIS